MTRSTPAQIWAAQPGVPDQAAQGEKDTVASEIAVHTEKNTDDIKTLLQQNTELTQAVEALTKEVHEKVCKTAV